MKIRRIHGFVLVKILFLSLNSFSQTSVYADSLEHFNNEALHFKKKGKIDAYRSTLIQLGEYQYGNSLYSESIETFNKAKLVRPLESDSLQFEALIGLGKGYTKQAMYASALENFVKALNIAKKSKSIRDEAIAWNHIGVIHWKEGKNDLAKRAYKEALKIRTRLKDQSGIAELYNNLGIIAKIDNDFEAATSYHAKALAIREQLNDRTGISQTLFNIGALKHVMGQPKEALKYYNESYIIKLELNNIYGKLPHFLNVGEAYLDMGDYSKAEFSFLEGLQLANELEANDYRMSFNQELSLLHAKQNNFAQAYHFQGAYMDIKDTLINIRNAEKLTELQIQYNTTEKQQRIEQLNLEKELNAEKYDQEIYMRNLLITFVAFVLIIFAFVLKKERSLQKANKLLSEQKAIVEQREKEKELLAREMHHRVKNNLQLTSSLLKLQSRNLKDEDAISALKEARSRIQTISIIHQKLYEFEDLSEINLAVYLPELCDSIFASNQISTQKIRLSHQIGNILVSIDSAISIGLFINEALLNSIKHAFPSQSEGFISIVVQKEGANILLKVIDDGCGINAYNDVDFGSFGFQLLRSFATKLNSSIQLDSYNGTAIQINIPINQQHDA